MIRAISTLLLASCCVIKNAASQQPQVMPLGFEAVSDSLNTLNERGHALIVHHALGVHGIDPGPGLELQFPEIPGHPQRELLLLRWDAAARCWRPARVSRLSKSRDRERGALRTVIREDGVYGVFTVVPASTTQRLRFPGGEAVSWRLAVEEWGVVVEGKGNADLALNSLPPNARLAIRLSEHDPAIERSLWLWCGIGNRRIHRGHCTYRISI